MKLTRLPYEFSICKVVDYSQVDVEKPFCFTGASEQEKSLVCPQVDVPSNTLEREDGWNAFRIDGVLDFSLIGILAKIATILAQGKIGIFVVSTFQTDYVLTKSKDFSNAINLLTQAGYEIDSLGLK